MSEIRDGRFGRLSPNGQHLACGAVQVSVDGVAVGPGTTPVWLDDGSILYTRQPDGALMRSDLGFAPSEIRPAAHEPSSLCVARDPIYPTHFAWRERDGVHTNLGRHVPLMFRPTFAGADLCWCLDTGATADLYREGRLVARTVHDVRGELDGRLCFVQVDGAEQWTCIEHPDGRVASWRLAGAQEYGPHVVDWRGEEWVLSHTRDDRLLLRTGNNGIVVATGATFEPDCAVLPDGRVRVIWADAAGVSRERLIEVTEPQVDLRQAPARDPWPLSTAYVPATDIAEIAIEDFLFVASARNGLHIPEDYPRIYTHHMQTRWLGATAVQQTKVLGDGARDAVWTLSGTKASGFIGLSIDYTDAKHGYRVMNRGANTVAALWPRTMPVGIAHRRDVPVDIVHVDGTVERATWGGYVEGVYRGPAMGDLEAGLWAVIVWDFSHVGKFERNVCRLSQGLAVWVETDERPDHAGEERQFVCTRNVARIPDPEPRFADALPTAPVTPPATPPLPETPVKIWAYNDADAIRVYEFLPLKYTTPIERGGLGRAGVDVLGYARWYHDAIRLLDGGWAVDKVLREINRRINAVAPEGLSPDAWPGEPLPSTPEAPAPTSTRRGQLEVAGRVYRDANGNRLPFYIHAGDLISRFSRDADGARRLLDEIVTLRADGGRFWSWLIGDPYWTGRFFRGDWSVLQRFVGECRARNLRLVLSQGDLWQAGEATARRWFTELAGFIRSEGPEWFDFVDGGNEVWHNPYGTEPDTIASAMRPLAGLGPILSLSDFLQDQEWPGNTEDERKEAMRREAARWKQSPARVLDGHPAHNTGDGCVRRTWNFPYELDADAWINSEARGYGRNVTVYDRVDRSVQLTTATATWMTGGAYVAMSSPGVISDGMKNGHFDAGESFLDMPGFHDLDALRRWLPQDVGGWRRVHGGNRPGSGRVFAVDNNDTRCDHAINDATGEYVAILYAGPYHQERDASVEDFDPQLGGGRRIVKGRIR